MNNIGKFTNTGDTIYHVCADLRENLSKNWDRLGLLGSVNKITRDFRTRFRVTQPLRSFLSSIRDTTRIKECRFKTKEGAFRD